MAPSAAGEYVGQHVEACGRVAEGGQMQGIEGRSTFINLGGAHPDQSFTVLI